MTIAKEPTRPICKSCDVRLVRSSGRSINGHTLWRKFCSSCDNSKYRKTRQVSLTCVNCNFVAVDVCQIDTVDGQSLCSNCNRLKIKQEKLKMKDNYEFTADATVDISSVKSQLSTK